VTGQRIADEVVRWLDQPELIDGLKQRFDALHRVLRIDAAATAGRVVLRQITGHNG
jgi:hypothetical protein